VQIRILVEVLLRRSVSISA